MKRIALVATDHEVNQANGGPKISTRAFRNSQIIHPIYQRLRCLSRLNKEFATAEWALGME